MKLIFQIIFLLSPLISSAFSTSRLPDKHSIDSNLKKILPEGYDIFYFKKGNLNLDKYLDYAIILEKEYLIEDDRPEFIFQIYSGKTNNTFELITENSEIVSLLGDEGCKPCGHIEEHINISNGQLIITVQGGGDETAIWERYYFEYNILKEDWYLYKFETYERNYIFDKNDEIEGVDQTATNVLTKKDLGTVTFNKCESSYLSKLENKIELIQGSEEPLKIEYAQSTIITYYQYIIIVNKSEEEFGESIVLVNRRTGNRRRITNYDEECFFAGLYKNQLFFSCGTDVIRGFTIYNINTASKWEIEEGVLSALIKDGKLLIESPVSEGRKKRFNLIDRECTSQICGYFEDIYYDLHTKQKQYLGEFTWKD
ncbi:MAG: hypothetical protein ACK45S_05405 [Sphingobacteriales bacterium]|jgi:hypothetical protein